MKLKWIGRAASTIREGARVGEAVPSQLVLLGADPHVVAADEERVVRRGRAAAGHEQGRGQRARRQPGGGRRRRVSAVREWTLQDQCISDQTALRHAPLTYY